MPSLRACASWCARACAHVYVRAVLRAHLCSMRGAEIRIHSFVVLIDHDVRDRGRIYKCLRPAGALGVGTHGTEAWVAFRDTDTARTWRRLETR